MITEDAKTCVGAENCSDSRCELVQLFFRKHGYIGDVEGCGVTDKEDLREKGSWENRVAVRYVPPDWGNSGLRFKKR